MAAPKFYRPDQPFLTRCFYWWFEFFASLKLAVVLISLVAFVLALATFVESNSGTAAVRYLIYHTKSFSLLMALLAMNIFFAAAIRYPWKKHQTGFVITHIGLLVLLAGSAISYRGSINSQLRVLHKDSNQIAVDTAQGYLLFSGIPGRPEPFKVRFTPGPYNWDDLAPYPIVRKVKSLFGQDDLSKPWNHPSEVIYDHDSTTIEIADFYARKRIHNLPFLNLQFENELIGDSGKMNLGVEYNTRDRHGKKSFGAQGEVLFWKSDQENVLEMFKETVPERSVEGNGMVVIWSNGERYNYTVDRLKENKKNGEAIELDDGRKVELVGYSPHLDLEALTNGQGFVSLSDLPKRPVVELNITETIDGKEKSYRVFNFAAFPFLPNKEDPKQFYSTLFHPSVKGRIDIIQDKENKLAFRAWQQKAKRVVNSGDLELNKQVSTWSMGSLNASWKMTLKEHLVPVDDKEMFRVIPEPFSKDNNGLDGVVQIRIKWKDEESDKSEEKTFWLRLNLPEPLEHATNHQIHYMPIPNGKNDLIQASYHVMETDVGSTVKLIDFDLDQDPGTTMAANYTSQVIVIDVRDENEIKELNEKVSAAGSREEKQEARNDLFNKQKQIVKEKLKSLEGKSPEKQIKMAGSDESMEHHIVTMNAPLDYPDQHGRILRLFQENYLPPQPELGMPVFASVFRVNYDPGRSLKYLGSLLVTLGIFTMFYMKAYFFKKPPQVSRRKKNKPDNNTGKGDAKNNQNNQEKQAVEEIPTV